MEITTNALGATVDITDDAHQLIDILADAYADRETHIGQLLVSLADARRALRTLKQDADTAGTDVPEWKVEHLAAEVDGIREAIAAALDPAERVTVAVTAHGCKRYAARLLDAAAQAAARLASLRTFPNQQDRRAA